MGAIPITTRAHCLMLPPAAMGAAGAPTSAPARPSMTGRAASVRRTPAARFESARAPGEQRRMQNEGAWSLTAPAGGIHCRRAGEDKAQLKAKKADRLERAR